MKNHSVDPKPVYFAPMNTKSVMIHGFWASATIAAFWLGTAGDNAISTSDVNDAPDSTNRRSSAGPGGIDDDRRRTKSSDRTSSAGDEGAISKLFGSSSLTGSSLEDLANRAFRDSNPINRRLAFSRLLEALTPENAMEIRSQLVANGADGSEWRDFNFSWGALAGKDAFDIAATTEENDLAATLSGWAAANPTAALAMLENLPEAMQDQRRELNQSVVSGLAARDPALATDLVMRLAADGNGDANRLIDIVARETLRSGGLEEASRWSESLPDGAVKGAAMARVASTYVRQDPEAAARWAETHAGNDYATRLIEEVGGEWAERNPVAAVSWLEKLPDGSGQSAGLRSAFSDWEDSDPAAASQHLLAMPVSAKRDSAINGFATGYAWQDPQLAIQWAGSINDPALRQESLTRVGQAYYQRDPESARTWLEQSNLPAEARQEILNGRRRR